MSLPRQETGVREFSLPALVPPPVSGSLASLIVDNAAAEPDGRFLVRKVGDAWQGVSAAEFLAEVTDVARGLVASGIGPGDPVGIMARTRYEWTVCDFAVWTAGAVPVPIYETSSPEQVRWILEDSGAVGCFVETTAHKAVLEQVRTQVPAVRHTWVFDTGGLDALISAGADVPDADLDGRRAALNPDTLATIIYTSGTTGRPKGCQLTHGQFLGVVWNAVEALPELFKSEGRSTLLFLPLAHVFARAVEVACVASRTTMGYTADVRHLVEDLASFQPTFVLAVPRVFEKVYNAAEQKAAMGGKSRIFAAATATAIAYSTSLDANGPGIGLRARHAVFDRLVYGKLRAALGGRVRWGVSGSAPLGDRLGHFFRGAGVTVIEGYGLTETTAPATANTVGRLKVGTVGRPMPGTAVRIAEDDEVLVRGPQIFRGYHNNPQATADAFTSDGWLRTGDLGRLDDEGFLRITGRKKEVLVTAGGKNVAPAPLEDQLRAHPLISQCIVVGDGKPYISALLTLDPEALQTWLELRGRPARPVTELTDDPEIRAEIQAAVDAANATVSRAESIRRFQILPTDFTEAGGQLTPTMKLKRNVVLKEFAAEVEALYR